MVTGHLVFPDRPRLQATTDELETHGLIEHNMNWIRERLNCQARPGQRIYGAADAGLVISFATYPSRCPR